MNVMNILRQQPVARVRHQLGIDAGLLPDDFFLIDQILNPFPQQPPHINIIILILIAIVIQVLVAAAI